MLFILTKIYFTAINLCEFGDSECVEETINSIFREHYGGIEEISLESLDPLHIKYLEIIGNPSSPVKISINLTDSILFGIKNMKAIGVK